MSSESLQQTTQRYRLDEENWDFDFLDELLRRNGQLYSDIKDHALNHYEETGETLSAYDLQAEICTGNGEKYKLHSHTMNKTAEKYRVALKGYFEKRKSDQNYPDLMPPYKDKHEYTVTWSQTGVKQEGTTITLKNGNYEEDIKYDIGQEFANLKIFRAELIKKQGRKYYLHFTFKVQPVDLTTGDGTAAVDFGEVHPMTVFDGEKCYLFNGGELRSEYQEFNKEFGEIQSELSRKEKGSNRYRKWLNARQQLVEDFRNRTKDILSKFVAKLVDTLLDDGVYTLVIGDLTGIREGLDYGSYVNQKIHQWVFGRLRFMIKYQCLLRGINVQEEEEAYTSQKCPRCGEHHGTSTRNYKCGDCGFEYHRDGVGAINIWYRWHEKNVPDGKYPGCAQVVADLAPASGIRYKPDMQCYSLSERRSSSILRSAALRHEEASDASGPKRDVTKSDEELASSDSVEVDA